MHPPLWFHCGKSLLLHPMTKGSCCCFWVTVSVIVLNEALNFILLILSSLTIFLPCLWMKSADHREVFTTSVISHTASIFGKKRMLYVQFFLLWKDKMVKCTECLRIFEIYMLTRQKQPNRRLSESSEILSDLAFDVQRPPAFWFKKYVTTQCNFLKKNVSQI